MLKTNQYISPIFLVVLVYFYISTRKLAEQSVGSSGNNARSLERMAYRILRGTRDVGDDVVYGVFDDGVTDIGDTNATSPEERELLNTYREQAVKVGTATSGTRTVIALTRVR